MLKNVAAIVLFTSLFIPVTHGQTYFGTGTTPAASPSRSNSAAAYKSAVDKISQQYDSTISQQVKQIMPVQPPPVTSGAGGQTVVAAPTTTTIQQPPQPMTPQPPPQTSVINQPSTYQPTATFNPNANNSFAPAAPTQAAPGGQVYTGFQSGTPANAPSNTSKQQAPNWNIKY